ncbi:MAG: type II toxin-antitoxin system HicA family toxin [Bacillota bacterium]|nr:type II toxin-antitoxin system HicA family toxin [Bacillota bacterium]
MKSISRRDLIKRLREFGFKGPFSGGKHSFMEKASLKLRIPNPHGNDIGVSLIKEILRQAGILEEEWEEN